MCLYDRFICRFRYLLRRRGGAFAFSRSAAALLELLVGHESLPDVSVRTARRSLPDEYPHLSRLQCQFLTVCQALSFLAGRHFVATGEIAAQFLQGRRHVVLAIDVDQRDGPILIILRSADEAGDVLAEGDMALRTLLIQHAVAALHLVDCANEFGEVESGLLPVI